MATKKPETTSPYIALVRIRNGAVRYQVGEQIDLLPSEAADLLAQGSITLAPAPAPTPAK